MRKFTVLCTILIALFTGLSNANAWQGSGQLQLLPARTFATMNLSDTTSLSLYGQGTFFYPIEASPIIFSYIGPQLKIKNTTINLLTGTFHTPDGGLSATASFWIIQDKFLFDNLHCLVEFDTYFPVLLHKNQSFYGYAHALYSVGEKTSVGVITEHFADTDVWTEAAVGPGLQLDNLIFWFGYDHTPGLPDKIVFFRLMLLL